MRQSIILDFPKKDPKTSSLIFQRCTVLPKSCALDCVDALYRIDVQHGAIIIQRIRCPRSKIFSFQSWLLTKLCFFFVWTNQKLSFILVPIECHFCLSHFDYQVVVSFVLNKVEIIFFILVLIEGHFLFWKIFVDEKIVCLVLVLNKTYTFFILVSILSKFFQVYEVLIWFLRFKCAFRFQCWKTSHRVGQKRASVTLREPPSTSRIYKISLPERVLTQVKLSQYQLMCPSLSLH